MQGTAVMSPEPGQATAVKAEPKATRAELLQWILKNESQRRMRLLQELLAPCSPPRDVPIDSPGRAG